MRKKKKLLMILLPLLLIVVAALPILVVSSEKAPMEKTLAKNVAENSETLRILLNENPDQYIDKRHEAFQKFTPLFSFPLISVDTRDTESMAFSFDGAGPESSLTLCYTESDRYVIREGLIASMENPEVKLENLGINGKGYIHCIRLQEGWFFVRSYLPT